MFCDLLVPISLVMIIVPSIIDGVAEVDIETHNAQIGVGERVNHYG